MSLYCLEAVGIVIGTQQRTCMEARARRYRAKDGACRPSRHRKPDLQFYSLWLLAGDVLDGQFFPPP